MNEYDFMKLKQTTQTPQFSQDPTTTSLKTAIRICYKIQCDMYYHILKDIPRYDPNMGCYCTRFGIGTITSRKSQAFLRLWALAQTWDSPK